MYLKLWEAATSGDENFIEEVVETNKTLLLEVSIDGNSSLHFAAKHDYHKIAMQVIEAHPSLLTEPNKSGDTPLHLASAAGHLRIVNLFIDQHRRLREHHRASSGGVEKEEDENDVVWMVMANKIGNTALHAATIGGHLNVVDRLLATAPQLATMTNRAGVSALYMASERGLLDIVRRILRVSPAVSHEGLRGQTALHAAVLRSYEISKMILDNDPAYLKHQDESKSTPLHFAADNGDAAMLRLLLERDASAGYMQDEEGFAIIHIAASAGNLDMIKEILEYCPDALEQKNNKGSNFVHVAVQKKNLKVVKYVLNSHRSAKELLNEQDHEGNTPLHLAVLASDLEMIRMLLSSRIVDTALANISGFTPIDLASLKYNIKASLRMRKQDEEITRYQALTNNLIVIAVLTATVTFAAAFTLPGGYKNDSESDEGMAILSSKATFKAFLISDTIATVCSVTAVIVLLHSVSLDHDVRSHSLRTATFLLWLAVNGMGMAFLAGVYTVIERHSKWVVVLASLIACGGNLFAHLVPSGYFADNWIRGLDPEELIRRAKRTSKFMDDITRVQAKWKSNAIDITVRIIQFYHGLLVGLWLWLPPTVTTPIQNYIQNLLKEEPTLAQKWFCPRHGHHEV